MICKIKFFIYIFENLTEEAHQILYNTFLDKLDVNKKERATKTTKVFDIMKKVEAIYLRSGYEMDYQESTNSSTPNQIKKSINNATNPSTKDMSPNTLDFKPLPPPTAEGMSNKNSDADELPELPGIEV